METLSSDWSLSRVAILRAPNKTKTVANPLSNPTYSTSRSTMPFAIEDGEPIPPLEDNFLLRTTNTKNARTSEIKKDAAAVIGLNI